MSFNKILVTLLIFFSTQAMGQSFYSNYYDNEQKSIIKVNLASPFINTYAGSFEYFLGSRVSLGFNFSYRPQKIIPFGKQLDSLSKKHGLGLTGVDFKNIYVSEALVQFLTLAPQLKFYLGKKNSKPYIGIFQQFEKYNMNVPASLLASYNGREMLVKMPVDFIINTNSTGFVMGKQFNITERLLIDLQLIGPHYGRATNFSGVVEHPLLATLNESERSYLKEKIIERFALSEKYYQVTVTDKQATIKNIANIPFLGVRAIGVSLGYRF